MTYKKGSSAFMASPPARKTAPSTRQAQSKTSTPASSAERTGRFALFPASSSTGAASKTFIPAYSTPIPRTRPKGSVPPRVKASTKATRTGTRMQLSREIPPVPLRKKSRTTASPPREIRGEHAGQSASSPASIPAQGTKESAETTLRTHFPPRENRASVAPTYPPCFLPRSRKKAVSAKKIPKEKNKERSASGKRKKRTSSAPDKKPAPMHVPTIKSVVWISPIFQYL